MELVELLQPMGIVVLGYYPVPDQTAPEQLREEHEAAATEALEPIVRTFVDAGTEVDTVLVFTRDRVQTIDRVANEHDCDAVLVPGSVDQLERVLVSLKDEMNMFRVLEVVGLLMADRPLDVTLFHAESVEKGSARSELYLRGATDWLTERRFPRERVGWEEPTEETQERDLLEEAADHDFLVVGESEPSIRERVVGSIPNRVADETGRPVLIVRKER